MYGTNNTDTEQGEKGIVSKLKVLAKHELLNEHELELIKDRIFITTSMDEVLEDCTFVIEAIPENIEVLFLKVVNQSISGPTNKLPSHCLQQNQSSHNSISI